jgi:hypothetical protein
MTRARERESIKKFANLLRHSHAPSAKKETGPDGGPVQFAGVGAPTISFQRGTAACIVVAIWEDGATDSPRSTTTMRGARVMHNAKLYMSAMRKICAR